MLRLFYNRNRTFHKLFWFFWNYFQDASLPTAENLFLLAISMLALKSPEVSACSYAQQSRKG